MMEMMNSVAERLISSQLNGDLNYEIKNNVGVILIF